MAQKNRKKKRKKRSSGGGTRHTGMMSAMRGGMQRAVRSGGSPKGSRSSVAGTALTVALILAAAALMLWRFG